MSKNQHKGKMVLQNDIYDRQRFTFLFHQEKKELNGKNENNNGRPLPTAELPWPAKRTRSR